MRALLWLAALPFVTACGEAADGFVSGFEQSFNAEFEKGFTKEFDKSCTDGAVAEGAAREPAAACCRCLSRRLLADNGALAVSKASLNPEGSAFQDMLSAAMGKCAECPKPGPPAKPQASPTAR